MSTVVGWRPAWPCNAVQAAHILDNRMPVNAWVLAQVARLLETARLHDKGVRS